MAARFYNLNVPSAKKAVEKLRQMHVVSKTAG